MHREMRSAVRGQSESEGSEATTGPFVASHRLALVDHLGIPSEVLGPPVGPGVERLRAPSGAELLWARADDADGVVTAARVCTAGAEVPIFARVVGDGTAERMLAQTRGDWSRVVALTTPDGAHLASIWRAGDGSVFLPFDPDDVCHAYWSERYRDALRGGASRRAQRGAMLAYYRVRGLLPRSTQIWLRRRYARRQARTQFPSWPVEGALHDFFDLFTSILADVAGEPVAHLAAWPHGHAWALVLTHDVETSAGVAAIQPVLELERRLGFRSSWNFVPRRYEVDDDLVRELIANGFEVGVHGLYHDGRDLESLALVQERAPAMRAAAERWSASGFRSPATHRDWELMPLIGFDYDSSYPDTDPFEPQGGGCCTWLPFFNQEMVELPLTMPQDHTLFVILRQEDETVWVRKAEHLRRVGGMALLDTHPDYLVHEHAMRAYRCLLERLASDKAAWKALPREVSAWWRRRAASRLQRAGSEWTVSGPAAGEAAVELEQGKPWR